MKALIAIALSGAALGAGGYWYLSSGHGTAAPMVRSSTSSASPASSTSPLHLAAFPVDAIFGRNASGNLALITFHSSGNPSPPASDFTATIKWGDGSTSPGTVVAAPSVVQSAVGAGGVAYDVQGSHTWSKLGPTSYEVTVTGPSGSSMTTKAPLEISPLQPTAFFTANPTNPVQDGIGLFVPADPQPGQLKISQYKWQILDGNTVVDNASTRPTYNSVLARLAQNPGNPALRQIGTNLGILPSDAKGGAFGVGGLTDDQVRQVVGVWQAYFPYHIVPHLFDFYGTVGVGLKVTDQTGHTSTDYTHNYTVSRDCQPWGGPLSSWFGGFTVCDTYNGIAAQFGPHRAPDYIGFNVTNILLPSGGRFLGFNGSVSLVIIPRLIASHPQHAVFIAPMISAGISTPGASAGITSGWLGPPGPANRPGDPEQIYQFVNGADLFGGFSATVRLWHLGLGLGFTALENPSNGLVGEELGFNAAQGASAGIGAGETCAFSLGTLSHPALNDMASLYSSWSQIPPSGSQGALTQQLTAALSAVEAGGVNPLAALVSGLQQCNPLASTTPLTSCSSDTFLDVVRSSYSSSYTHSLVGVGQPTCVGGYAEEDFVPYAGGQQAPFFFNEVSPGKWNLIEGGDTGEFPAACSTIPPAIMAKLGFGCPTPQTQSCSIPGGAEGGLDLPFTATGLSCADGTRLVRAVIAAIPNYGTAETLQQVQGFVCQLAPPAGYPPGSHVSPGWRVTCTKGAETLDFELPG